MLTIFHGRPENCSSREPREVRVYDLLDRLNVEYDRLDHEPAATMEICAEIDAAFERMPLASFMADVNANKSSHPIICKNLFCGSFSYLFMKLCHFPAKRHSPFAAEGVPQGLATRGARTESLDRF